MPKLLKRKKIVPKDPNGPKKLDGLRRGQRVVCRTLLHDQLAYGKIYRFHETKEGDSKALITIADEITGAFQLSSIPQVNRNVSERRMKEIVSTANRTKKILIAYS